MYNIHTGSGHATTMTLNILFTVCNTRLNTVHFCVCYGSQNKQRFLFPYTALSGFYSRYGVCYLRHTFWGLIQKEVNL